MLPSLAAASLAGLIGSPHCVGMCGGFAAACGSGRAGVAWTAGRLTTYALLGATAATLGGALPGPGWVAGVVSTLLLIWFAGALAGLLPEPAVRIPGLGRLAGRAARGRGAGPGFVLGLTTGLLPCGLVYAALAVPIASGEAWIGAASMVAFGVGTTPALTAVVLGARKAAVRDLRTRRLLAAGVLVLGLLSVGMRQGFGPGSHAGHDVDGPTAPHAPAGPAGASPLSVPAATGG